MDFAYLFTPFLQVTSFWSGGFTTATAVNQRDRNLGNSIFVHFDMTFSSTLTGILDFANLIFQTLILQAEKFSLNLGKNQAEYFKLENCKKQVQINRGNAFVYLICRNNHTVNQ